MLSAELLRILVDPEDKGSLFYFEDESVLYNPRLKRSYEVKNSNIPVMLAGDATAVDEAEHTRLSNKAQKEELKPTGAGS